jgi:hypothetical protein
VSAEPQPQRVVYLACVQHHDMGTVLLVPVGPLSHGTPKQDGGVKMLQHYAHTGARNRQGERAMHPLAQDQGMHGPFSVSLLTSDDGAPRHGNAGVRTGRGLQPRRLSPIQDRLVLLVDPRLRLAVHIVLTRHFLVVPRREEVRGHALAVVRCAGTP